MACQVALKYGVVEDSLFQLLVREDSYCGGL